MNRKELTAILTNWRYYALLAVAAVATIGILGDTDTMSVTTAFVLAKAIGFAAAYLFYRLFRFWAVRRKIDELLRLTLND